jgi:predicted secreted protein
MKTVLALSLLITTVAAAPVAAADENSYLQRIEPRMAQLTRDQILTEGYKVCQLTRSGHGSSDAIPMVTKDLAVSVPAAADIIAAAVVELGC